MVSLLFVGPIKSGSTTLHRLNAIKNLGLKVSPINTLDCESNLPGWSLADRMLSRLYRSGFPLPPGYHDRLGVNKAILRALGKDRIDAIWIEKGLSIENATFEAARKFQPSVKIIGYSPDDMSARHNHSKKFLNNLPEYDFFFTTKSYNVPELRALGCRDVTFVDNAFDPATHRPLDIDDKFRSKHGGEVGFIGSWEEERAQNILFLAEQGIPVRVYGGNWERKVRSKPAGLTIEEKTVIGDDYAKTICSFDINLHFLRKINRDQQTTRSIELPACAAFMLAERTDEHKCLFEEGKEAEFFSSKEELLEKTLHYLRNNHFTQEIGLAGYQRCIDGGYSNEERLRGMLEHAGVL